ncbi:MAG: enoyl-CoA hydratase/isomerase family protein [Alphaproteobacteria bacterium]
MSRAGDDILFERRGKALLITLNRPKALNALSLEMCLDMEDQLDKAMDDASVELVIVRGAGGRALCAGGDIRRVCEEGQAGNWYPYQFFKNEYRLNAKLYHFPKPYIALMDGIVMGGGVGLAVHGTWRVVSDRINFAMPETAIGLFPDVGGGYFMPRMPGRLGLYLALTGTRIKAADVLYAGCGDMMVPADQMGPLAEALCAGGDIEATIKRFSAEPEGHSILREHREAIDEAFAGNDMDAIVAALGERTDDWSVNTLQLLMRMSPTAMKITCRQFHEGAKKDFNACMVMEYRMACGCITGHDFYEGVRAVIVDKDNAPQWQPASLAEISDADVAAYFDKVPPDGDIDDLPPARRKD